MTVQASAECPRDTTYQTAKAVLEAVKPALDNPKRSFVTTGVIVWDGTGCSPQLSVSVTSYSPIGSRVAGGTLCLTGWLITMDVTMLRCATIASSNGGPPPAATLDSEAQQVLDDAQNIYWALLESGIANPDVWTALSADGGLSGGSWQVTATVPLSG